MQTLTDTAHPLSTGFSFNALFGAPVKKTPKPDAALNFAIGTFEHGKRKGKTDVGAALAALLAYQELSK